jgi:hypothetical protein
MIFCFGIIDSSLAELTRGPHDVSRAMCLCHCANTILMALKFVIVMYCYACLLYT